MNIENREEKSLKKKKVWALKTSHSNLSDTCMSLNKSSQIKLTSPPLIFIWPHRYYYSTLVTYQMTILSEYCNLPTKLNKSPPTLRVCISPNNLWFILCRLKSSPRQWKRCPSGSWFCENLRTCGVALSCLWPGGWALALVSYLPSYFGICR